MVMASLFSQKTLYDYWLLSKQNSMYNFMHDVKLRTKVELQYIWFLKSLVTKFTKDTSFDYINDVEDWQSIFMLIQVAQVLKINNKYFFRCNFTTWNMKNLWFLMTCLRIFFKRKILNSNITTLLIYTLTSVTKKAKPSNNQKWKREVIKIHTCIRVVCLKIQHRGSFSRHIWHDHGH